MAYTPPTQSVPPPAPQPAAPFVPPKNGLGLTALILGIIGVLFGLIPITFFIAGTLGVIALIFGIVGIRRAVRKTATNKAVAIIGTVLAVAALGLSVVGVVIVNKVVDDVSNVLDNNDGAKDVSIAAIEKGEFGSFDATVTVENSAGNARNYWIDVQFLDDKGTVVDSTSVLINHIAPGQTATDVATVFPKTGTPVTAKVVKAQVTELG
ncbi:hypothetical protein Afil01_06860 [Actinorhabdospora filicis]|uniref:DUF4190 domain-containing protein n=1 Tax=Actinorhabdospora filicis TaxID=1785913 RepID=A0A9W6SI28_9ACTN|nr:DUF4190 domain-containing protein [Actinorhabdospora filicis]GLZ75879.1 hypothetical protein Afil01_06860 [Actinorhabdospora filicis]